MHSLTHTYMRARLHTTEWWMERICVYSVYSVWQSNNSVKQMIYFQAIGIFGVMFFSAKKNSSMEKTIELSIYKKKWHRSNVWFKENVMQNVRTVENFHCIIRFFSFSVSSHTSRSLPANHSHARVFTHSFSHSACPYPSIVFNLPFSCALSLFRLLRKYCSYRSTLYSRFVCVCVRFLLLLLLLLVFIPSFISRIRI